MPETERDERRAPRTSGLGRVLITVYLILAIGATLRAVYQIIAKFDEAPLAYTLSLVSGLVYVVATIALIKRTGRWRTVAWVTLVFEFAGVIVVGILSLLVPALFAHPSVWSWFGAGYLMVPLVLPVLGMLWLRREGSRAVERSSAEQPSAEQPSAEQPSAEQTSTGAASDSDVEAGS